MLGLRTHVSVEKEFLRSRRGQLGMHIFSEGSNRRGAANVIGISCVSPLCSSVSPPLGIRKLLPFKIMYKRRRNATFLFVNRNVEPAEPPWTQSVNETLP